MMSSDPTPPTEPGQETPEESRTESLPETLSEPETSSESPSETQSEPASETEETPEENSSPTPSRSPTAEAWKNAGGVFLAGSVVIGLGCFVLLGNLLDAVMSLFWAAVCWEVGFAVGLGFILYLILLIQKRQGETLRDLGLWRAAPRAMIGWGFALGITYVVAIYFMVPFAIDGENPFHFHWVRLALIPIGIFIAVAEETMMRGFFMNQLQKVKVPVWLQIVATGACSAVYHSFHNPTLLGFLPAFALFSLHGWLYVKSNRSLTPVMIAHSLYHVLTAPYLLMVAMTQL